jgi:hypothetical protein
VPASRGREGSQGVCRPGVAANDDDNLVIPVVELMTHVIEGSLRLWEVIGVDGGQQLRAVIWRGGDSSGKRRWRCWGKGQPATR